MLDLEQLEHQIASVRSHLEYLEGLRTPVAPTSLRSASDEVIRRLLFSAKWPTAIDPRSLCDPNSDTEKIRRARGMLENLIDRQITPDDTFLDFGCGEGHLAWAASEMNIQFSLGYDIKSQGWCRYPLRSNLVLTSNWTDVVDQGPYKLIVAYDVMDHTREPEEALGKIREALSPDGIVYLRCHPWTARHGAHGCHHFNRAYCHLIFPEEDLNRWGWQGLETQKITQPLTTYRKWFENSGFRVFSERIQTNEVEKFFFGIPQITRKIAGLEEILPITFVDFILLAK